MDTNSTVESLKELDDLEFEIMFIDNIYKKLKSLDKPDMRTETLLFMYMSVVEALKKYKALAKEGSRTVPHEDVVDLILSKGEGFLTSVANDNSKAPYTQQSLSDLREWSKSLLLMLKMELLDKPKYTHLKK
jgi:hypothetical protein